jgi:hypothetical protein
MRFDNICMIDVSNKSREHFKKGEKMKMRSLVTGLIVIVLSVTLVGKAIAAGSFSTYNMTIPKLGGANTTSNVTKVSSSDKAVVCSDQIGGGYTLNARIELLNGSVAAGYQSISNDQRREYTLNPSTAGLHTTLASPRQYLYLLMFKLPGGGAQIIPEVVVSSRPSN